MTSRHTILVACIAVAALAIATVAGAAPCKLADLHWLQGIWRYDTATTQSEERWTIGLGDRLMGSSWLLHSDTPGGVIEASTIQNDGDTVTMRLRHFNSTLSLAREEKGAPMVFTAPRCDAGSVVFDGQGTQAGEHMTYRRNGDGLVFLGDFIHQGQPVHVEVDFTKAGE
jgi:Domain of unknown function (DUF6265)